MRVNVINKLWILFVVAALCIGAGLFRPASVEAISLGLPGTGGRVSEAGYGGYGGVSFTVEAYEDQGGTFAEFAVGNNSATGAWTGNVSVGDWEPELLSDYGWSGTIATRTWVTGEGGYWSPWSSSIGGQTHLLPWLDELGDSNGFGGYSTAFLYTMWAPGYWYDGDNNLETPPVWVPGDYYGSYLPYGMTDGFFGTISGLVDSPYAIYAQPIETVYFGDTDPDGVTPVPEPASLPLLLAGIGGLVWLKRRFIG